MKKKLNKQTKYIIYGIIILIAITISLIITQIINKPAKETLIKEKENIKEKINPLMYEITKKGSNNKIYLFGSIHIADTNKLEFPKYITDAYNNSKYVACEFDLVEYQKDQNKILETMQDLIYSDGSTIKDHLSTDTYNKIVNFLKEKGMYTEMYDIYKPMFFE